MWNGRTTKTLCLVKDQIGRGSAQGQCTESFALGRQVCVNAMAAALLKIMHCECSEGLAQW